MLLLVALSSFVATNLDAFAITITLFAQIELIAPITVSHEKRLIRYLYLGKG